MICSARALHFGDVISAAGDAAAPHGPPLRTRCCVRRRGRLNAQLRLHVRLSGADRFQQLLHSPTIQVCVSLLLGMKRQGKRARVRHALRSKTSSSAPLLPAPAPPPQAPRLLRQDLPNQVAAAAAHVAPHLLAVAIEDEGGHLGRTTGSAWVREGGKWLPCFSVVSAVLQSNPGAPHAALHWRCNIPCIRLLHLGHIQLLQQVGLVVTQQARKGGVALQGV